jgi:hypothetical protein
VTVGRFDYGYSLAALLLAVLAAAAASKAMLHNAVSPGVPKAMFGALAGALLALLALMASGSRRRCYEKPGAYTATGLLSGDAAVTAAANARHGERLTQVWPHLGSRPRRGLRAKFDGGCAHAGRAHAGLLAALRRGGRGQRRRRRGF